MGSGPPGAHHAGRTRAGGVRTRALRKQPTKRLTWAEQREWDGMEAAILAAEERLATCQAAAHDPTIATRADELAARWRAVHDAQTAVDRLFARWAELDAKRA